MPAFSINEHQQPSARSQLLVRMRLYPPFVAYLLLPTFCCPPFVAHLLLPTFCCPPFVAHQCIINTVLLFFYFRRECRFKNSDFIYVTTKPSFRVLNILRRNTRKVLHILGRNTKDLVAFCVYTLYFVFQTRRQTRSSSANSQPLSPSCSENIIPEPTKPTQTSVQPLKAPASTASLGNIVCRFFLHMQTTYES